MEEKQAEKVSILLMNPRNGEIYACVNVPEFDLNHPFDLGEMDTSGLSEQEIQDARNQMWRNGCINDTYEPGSVFKIHHDVRGAGRGRGPSFGFVLLSWLLHRGGPEDPLS